MIMIMIIIIIIMILILIMMLIMIMIMNIIKIMIFIMIMIIIMVMILFLSFLIFCQGCLKVAVDKMNTDLLVIGIGGIVAAIIQVREHRIRIRIPLHIFKKKSHAEAWDFVLYSSRRAMQCT